MKMGLTLAGSQCHHKDQMRSCLQSMELRKCSGDAQPILIHSGSANTPCSERNPRRNIPDLTSHSPFAVGVNVLLLHPCSSWADGGSPSWLIPACRPIPADQHHLLTAPHSGTSCWLSEIGHGRTVYTIATGNAPHQSSHPGTCLSAYPASRLHFSIKLLTQTPPRTHRQVAGHCGELWT